MSNQGNRGGGRGRARGAGGPPRGGPSQGGPAAGGSPRGGTPQGGFRGGPPYRGDQSGPGRGRGRGEGSGQGTLSSAGGRGGGFQGGPPQGGTSTIYSPGTPALIDRQRNAAADQLVAAFKGLAISPERPLRPGYGTLGREITLRANFFPVKVPKGVVYEYKITISPNVVGGEKRRLFDLIEMQSQYQAHRNYIAHDRSERLVSAKKLPDPLSLRIPYFEDGEQGPRQGAKVYTVDITFQRDLDMRQLTEYLSGDVAQRDTDLAPILSALNIVLQQHPSHTGMRVGKNRYFFPTARGGIPIALGVEAWQGFFTSVRPAHNQLMVNVNVAMTAFYIPGNLADAMLAFQQNTRGGMPTAFARGIKVATSHLGYTRRYTVRDIGQSSARRTTFDCDGKIISVEQYMREKYRIQLRHADDLPVVNVGAKTPTYLPAEICNIIPGQPYGKLNEQETAQMIRHACQPPAVNANAIMSTGLRALGHHPAEAPLNGFGITIEPQMAVVPGRELPPPRVSYRSGAPRLQNGSWNILQSKFQKGGNLGMWWVLVVRDGPRDEFQGPNDPKLINFLKAFAQKCQDAGLTVPSPPQILSTPNLPRQSDRDRTRTGALQIIQKTIKDKLDATRGKPTFILVLLSGRDSFIYPGIKRIGDVLLGVQTVHMLLSKALKDRGQDQYFSNVALKVNAKLGGINHLLDRQDIGWLTDKKTMLVGMDVTHAGPKSIPGTPSIAAVVASIDDNFVQYPASLRPQETLTEMIQELRDMMVERLKLYEKMNRRLPERIIVFRDGVSEGQYDAVIREELPQILDAFKKVRQSPAYRPKLSIAICGKRHHARFYPTDSAFADRNGNTRPGTVVDRGVTEVYGFDFYLQAHAGLQGTVKATHYIVIYDENDLKADALQQGAHTQSYLYARATKAVSLIPPAYYADLACERGRFYINEFLNLGDDKASSTGSTRQDRDETKRRVFEDAKRAWGEGLHPDIRETMFYI
ncbi:argonaute-like protein [Gloeophyllum trabeum ATCC 11539]|uniref:Argonaute-like protein n=1 Tax=Gloeophyllum trabeum (strain ATCC 11539 / FP-39264 / Madison 617) TaxID=670483 RepID=S7RGG6_GLOTA|nr:argonaute-like protein [Gloeophyllum trabeum ATCC 11539]EPQ53315.1 argonaute-like protein [Gloeophyllum trabeum ATCC 11539]